MKKDIRVVVEVLDDKGNVEYSASDVQRYDDSDIIVDGFKTIYGEGYIYKLIELTVNSLLRNNDKLCRAARRAIMEKKDD